ncbi:hypothetical protein ACFE04_009959 [Oxalis oulophora]
MNSTTLAIPIMFLCCFQFLAITVSSFEFQVGDANIGWSVPNPNDTNIYNTWASENRFRVGDSLRFKYTKDSVMEVREEAYKTCNSNKPMFFSNSGDTVFKLDYPGTFYFISGASGHCEMGQKMILKVMAPGDRDDDDHNGPGKSSASALNAIGFYKLVLGLVYACSCLLF